MENLFKKQYEISLWEDVLYWHRRKLELADIEEVDYEPGKFYSQEVGSQIYGEIPYVLDLEPYNIEKVYYSLAAKEEGNFLEGASASDIDIEENADWRGEDGALVPNTIFQFYKEQKICVIGSDTMDSPIRAHEPKLTANTNGSSTLTFNMYYKYYDYETDSLVDNPFIKLLVNERKVKLRHGEHGANGTKWYDFVIKSVQENSENYTFSYTAKSLFVNELSKSGFNIQLDAKLENNQGTILELAETVLEGSDWKIHPDSDISLQQTKSEALYEFLLNKTIKATSMNEDREEIEIEAGKVIFGFYTSVSEKLPFFQFLYNEDGYETDEERHITNSPNYYIENTEYAENGYPNFTVNQEDSFLSVTTTYRGKRVVRQSMTQFDPVMERYVNLYKDSNTGDTVYGYIDEQYLSPIAVRNFVVNATDYDSTSGWDTSGASMLKPKEDEGAADEYEIVQPEMNVRVLPDIFSKDYVYNPDLIYKSFLGIKFKSLNQGIMNFGLAENRSVLNGFSKGQKFIFRIKAGLPNVNNDIDKSDLINLKAKVVEYKLDKGVYTLVKEFIRFDELVEDKDGYVKAHGWCVESMSYSEMTKTKLGFYIYPASDSTLNTEIYIEDVQLFYEEKDANGIIVYPDDVFSAIIKQEYVYYYPPIEGMVADEVVPLHRGEQQPDKFIQLYNDDINYEKIRSITAQESNRFNLIQDLCETFECWPLFIIDHDEDGAILMDENYRQRKWVTFKEFIGSQNDIGFRYGINLKSITRTVDSEAIVTKMVVKNNANEHGVDGYCSIARAQENPNRQNFLLEFDYYVSQGMLDFDEVWNDLYTAANGYIGYFTRLKEMSILEELLIKEQANLFVEQSKLESSSQTSTLLAESSQGLLKEKHKELEEFSGYTFDEIMSWVEPPEAEEVEDPIGSWRKNDQVRALCQTIAKLTHDAEKAEAEAGKSTEALNDNLDSQKAITKQLADIKTKKLALDLQFYKKYSRFLQEGSWIDENYVDDNLYYLDAESTLYTSAHPKVTYNINVLELSRIPEYENYIFNLGDKTFIEDTEFFGWTTSSNGIRTPRHEEIIVNEIIIMLDSPERNEIKVQNYKTQFEDLFQRITATTQSVEYSTGKYDKASSVVQADGTIAPSTLQNSMANNSFIISNASDQSVTWDSSGITTTSLSSPHEMVRIVSGGIFISKDGGKTWNTGITGEGINASYLTTGRIDTSKINILAGSFPSFRWDSVGLSAYGFELAEDGQTGKNFKSGQFVRFDQYGLYGINGYANFNPLIEDEDGIGEDKIWKNAHFALTWKGFLLKNDDGSVRITSDSDIQVLDGQNERIKIGRLGQNKNYGLRIKDEAGNVVMVTKDDGTLWLENALYIGADTKSIEEATVRIGLLEEARDGVHEVIHAGSEENEFIVYEDGKMYASGAEFHGKIYATGGKIGNMTIEGLEEAINEKTLTLIITSSNGTYFKNNVGETVLTAKLYQGGEENDPDGTTYIYTWSWLEGNERKTASGKTLSVMAEEISEGRVYACEVSEKETDGGV